MVNHYEVLGVDPGANAAKVKAAYIAAARRHHPDFHAGASASVQARHAERMVLINEAWAVLSDPASRAAYDRRPMPSSTRGPSWSPPRTERVRYRAAGPPGKGWTPRADDDGWMDDYAAWTAETDVPPPDGPGPGPVRGVLSVVPVGLFVSALLLVLLGAAFGSRQMLAAAFIVLVLSVGSFVFAPMIQMVWDRRHR